MKVGLAILIGVLGSILMWGFVGSIIQPIKALITITLIALIAYYLPKLIKQKKKSKKKKL